MTHVTLSGQGLIEVQGLSKLYGEFPAVSGLSFTVGPGEVIGLVGPNGAGKTTTLRSIAGIVPPSEGTIRVAGYDLVRDPLPARQRLAFVPDEPHLFEYLTVQEHLRFVARIYQVAEPDTTIPPLLEELELTPHRDKLPGELSRGMKQKLAIACGLLHEPIVLLFDEPLTGLDPVGIRRMKNTILARAHAGAAVVLSSHLLHLVEELCSSILVLQRGKLVAHGSINDIVAERPQLSGRGLEEVFLALTGDAAADGAR